MKINEIYTPAILLDLDAMEHNLKNMQTRQKNTASRFGRCLKHTKA